jgi:hypothetical protein
MERETKWSVPHLLIIFSIISNFYLQ